MNNLLMILLLLFSAIAHSDDAINIHYFISDKSSAPLQIPSENSGIVTDVLEKLAMPNVNLTYKTLPFKRMVLMLEKSKTPWITYGSAKWQDSRINNLSATPLMTVQHVLMTTPATRYDSIVDILNRGIVLIRGFNYPGLIDYIKQMPEKVVYVKTHEAAIKMVLKGRAAAFVEMKSRLNYQLKKLAIKKENVIMHDFSDIIPNYDINLSFSNNFPKAHRTSIESQLLNLKTTGQLETILQKYD
ncbi:MAG: hypothetical protein ACPG5R_09615 [Cognaticolwellia aestuarii]